MFHDVQTTTSRIANQSESSLGRPESIGLAGDWLPFDKLSRAKGFGRRASISKLCSSTGLPLSTAPEPGISTALASFPAMVMLFRSPVSTFTAISSPLPRPPFARKGSQPRRSVRADRIPSNAHHK